MEENGSVSVRGERRKERERKWRISRSFDSPSTKVGLDCRGFSYSGSFSFKGRK